MLGNVKLNKMAKFAKLFDLKNGEQVLITREWNGESEQDEITFCTSLPRMMARITHGFKEEKDCDKAWDKIGELSAISFREDMENL